MEILNKELKDIAKVLAYVPKSRIFINSYNEMMIMDESNNIDMTIYLDLESKYKNVTITKYNNDNKKFYYLEETNEPFEFDFFKFVYLYYGSSLTRNRDSYFEKHKVINEMKYRDEIHEFCKTLEK